MTLYAVLRGLALGLSAGVGCLGFCLPVAAPALFGQNRTGLSQSAKTLGLFLLGRLAAYMSLATASGLLGSALSTAAAIQAVVLPITYVLLGLLMVLFGATLTLANLSLCRLLRPTATSRWFPAILGFLTGASPCPPFVLALAVAADAGSVTNALLFFASFYVSTSLYLLPLLFSGFATRFGPVRTAARVIAIVVGCYFAALGVSRILTIPDRISPARPGMVLHVDTAVSTPV